MRKFVNRYECVYFANARYLCDFRLQFISCTVGWDKKVDFSFDVIELHYRGFGDNAVLSIFLIGSILLSCESSIRTYKVFKVDELKTSKRPNLGISIRRAKCTWFLVLRNEFIVLSC